MSVHLKEYLSKLHQTQDLGWFQIAQIHFLIKQGAVAEKGDGH